MPDDAPLNCQCVTSISTGFTSWYRPGSCPPSPATSATWAPPLPAGYSSSFSDGDSMEGTPSTRVPSMQSNSLWFTTPCIFVYWTVPSGVHNITLRLWGSGGAGGSGGAAGGSGAYVEGVAYVTPNETLQINVGLASQGNSAVCGYGGDADLGSAGGAGSFVSRNNVFSETFKYNLFSETWDVMAVAGGGGGYSAYQGTSPRDNSGHPGIGIPRDHDCGPYGPRGSSHRYECVFSAGGGGGWKGGDAGCSALGGPGGTSCAPGCINATVFSLSGFVGGFAPFEHSPYYKRGVAASDPWSGVSGPGLVVISWDGPSPSPSNSAAATVSPTTLTSFRSASASDTATPILGVTSSLTASESLVCHPSMFQSFPTNGCIGTPVGVVSFRSTPYSCQLACCSVPGCNGYSFNSGHILLGDATAPCFQFANVTQLIPSHAYISGVLSSLIAAGGGVANFIFLGRSLLSPSHLPPATATSSESDSATPSYSASSSATMPRSLSSSPTMYHHIQEGCGHGLCPYE